MDPLFSMDLDRRWRICVPFVDRPAISKRRTKTTAAKQRFGSSDFGDLEMIRKAIARLHRDEQGIEALQAVLVMAIAAVILAVVKAKWPAIKGFFNTGVDGAVSFDG